MKIYYLTDMEIRNLKWISLCQKSMDLTGIKPSLLLEVLENNLFLCIFQFLEATYIPQPVAPSFFKTSNIASSNLSLTLKDLCDHIELTQIMQDNFLILTSADQQLRFYLPPFFPFPRNITYPQALGTGKGHLWQGCYTVYHKLVFDFPENKFSSLLCEDRCYSSCLGLHSAKTQTSSILLLHHQYMASSSWSKMIS